MPEPWNQHFHIFTLGQLTEEVIFPQKIQVCPFKKKSEQAAGVFLL